MTWSQLANVTIIIDTARLRTQTRDSQRLRTQSNVYDGAFLQIYLMV